MAKQDEQFTSMKRVKELVALMKDNDLTEVELVEDKSKISLRRAGHGLPAIHAPVAHVPHPAHHAPAPAPATAPTEPAQDEKLVPIKSPLVGTFYSAPNPQSDPYVSIGSSIAADTVICIVEAMKVFNEIRAETSGTIAKILVQNGQSVEFGQPIFMVKPN